MLDKKNLAEAVSMIERGDNLATNSVLSIKDIGLKHNNPLEKTQTRCLLSPEYRHILFGGIHPHPSVALFYVWLSAACQPYFTRERNINFKQIFLHIRSVSFALQALR